MDGKEIGDVRRRLRLSQAQWAELCGVTRPTVSDWERGRYKAPASVSALATLLRNEPGRMTELRGPKAAKASGSNSNRRTEMYRSIERRIAEERLEEWEMFASLALSDKVRLVSIVIDAIECGQTIEARRFAKILGIENGLTGENGLPLMCSLEIKAAAKKMRRHGS